MKRPRNSTNESRPMPHSKGNPDPASTPSLDDSSSHTDNSSSNDEQDSGSDMEGQVIPIEFDFYGLVDSDFYGIKRFLSLLLGPSAGDELNGFNDLADLIIEEGFGNTVKCGPQDSQPFGICALIGISGPHWATDKVTGPLHKYITNQFTTKCPKLISLMGSSDNFVENDLMGFLVYDRLINTPWQISAPLFRLLLNELTDSNDSKYQFKYLLVICPLFVPKQISDDKTGRSGGQLKKRRREVQISIDPMHTYLELEEFEKECEFSFDFSVSSPGSAEPSTFSTSTSRRALVVSVSKLPKLIDALDQLVLDSDELINQEPVETE